MSLSALPALTQSLHEANARLHSSLDRLLPDSASAPAPRPATPQQMEELLSELMKAGQWLRTLPAEKPPALEAELCAYRKNVEQLRDLLPSIQGALLRERARLEHERARVDPLGNGSTVRARRSDRLCDERSAAKLCPCQSTKLLDVIEQVGLLGLGHRFKRGLPRGLSTLQIADHLRQIGAADGLLLLRQLRSLTVQKGLLGIELIHGIAVENALRVDVLVRAADFVDGGVDVGAGLQAGNEVLHRLEHVASRARKQLRSRQIRLQGKVAADRDRIRGGIPRIVHARGAGRVEDIGRGLRRRAGENVAALIREVRQADQLRLDALHLGGDRRPVGIVQRAVGSLDAQADGALQRCDHRIQG